MNIGIIGAGWFGEVHAQAIGQLEGLKLVAACRSDAAGLEAFCARYGVQGHLNAHDLLNDPAIEAVVIATPHHLHTEMTMAALHAGKHVLLEKPMAPSLEECDRIVQAARAARTKLMVGHTNRFALPYRTAKAILESGEVGEVRLGSSEMTKYWMEPNRRSWHQDRASGGGMLLTAGIHALDRLIWLVGSDVSSVTASLGTYFHDQCADDAALLFLRFQNGVAASVTSVGYSQGAPNHMTQLVCTRGMLRVSYDEGVQIGRNNRWSTVPDSSREDWMLEAVTQEWRALHHAVQTDTDPPVTAEAARHVMAVIFAAETSNHLSGMTREI